MNKNQIGVQFATGLAWPSARPVILRFIDSRGKHAETTWSIPDAEAMAHALLDKVERARREQLRHPPKLLLPQ